MTEEGSFKALPDVPLPAPGAMWQHSMKEQFRSLSRDWQRISDDLGRNILEDVMQVQNFPPTSCGGAKSTVGLMLDGCVIDNLLIGGPAYSSGELDKGDGGS